eukprot:scaffold110551_cov36-Tisochrysis_lutea.AAC.1
MAAGIEADGSPSPVGSSGLSEMLSPLITPSSARSAKRLHLHRQPQSASHQARRPYRAQSDAQPWRWDGTRAHGIPSSHAHIT